jgi:thioredoxin-related protein
MEISGKSTIAFLAGLLLASCGGDRMLNLKEAMPPPGFGPIIRSSPEGGTPVAPGGNAQPLPNNITASADIAWTGFDGEGIPELENLMAAPKKGPWEESEAQARQTATREGKPILVWFTDSARSPMCKVLGAELFSTPDFGKWADKHLVRLRIDANVSADDPNLSLDEKITREADMKAYVKQLKKRYRVLGQPSVLLLNPSGEVVARYRGYKRGDADYFWGLIKHGVAVSETANQEWRKGLEAKGYREWEGKRGRKVFAKLVSYSDGKLVLIEPGGERYRTDETSLSGQDRKWIEEQKAMRGIE